MATMRLGSRGMAGAPVPSGCLRSFTGFVAAPPAQSAAGTIRASFGAPAAGGERGRLVVRMARVGGVEIPNQKRLETALTYIYGIGPTTAKAILVETNVENKRTRELSEQELTSLRDEVSKYQVEGDLRRFNLLAIKRLTDISCYRGRRHRAGLPVRGQNTKRNARTRKGKKVTVAGKKKATR